MPKVSPCSSCGRGIIWTTSPSGARLPLDARPVTVYQIEEDDVYPGGVGALDYQKQINDIVPGTKLYVSHFVTCPNAAQHSRGRS